MIPHVHSFSEHVIDIACTTVAIGALGVAAIIDATQSPIGLPGAEYIGMFGVIWLLFRNLDKREDRQGVKDTTEEKMLAAIHLAIQEHTAETRRLRAVVERQQEVAAAMTKAADAATGAIDNLNEGEAR